MGNVICVIELCLLPMLPTPWFSCEIVLLIFPLYEQMLNADEI